MNKEIIEYTINHNGYQLTVLNIGATIVEYSLNGHNICLSYADYEDYRTNEIYMGSIIGRTAGRTRNRKEMALQLPQNYESEHNLHGNDLHLAFYEVQVNGNQIHLTLEDPEGIFPGNAQIEVIYQLTDTGLVQEIIAHSDKPTLFNFTNHSYFNLDFNKTVLEQQLQMDAYYYSHLDKQMFVVVDKPVLRTAFDFRKPKLISSAMEKGNDQFKVTKFIDHPFKLTGPIEFSSDNHKLVITSTSDYVVVYAGNYIGDLSSELANCEKEDYKAICFETQKRPGNITLTQDYYMKTSYQLLEK